jgi:hypothetical protein
MATTGSGGKAAAGIAITTAGIMETITARTTTMPARYVPQGIRSHVGLHLFSTAAMCTE